jgi:hypothetical protein
MHFAPDVPALHALSPAGGWLTKRWYYTPRSNRAYSVRQISPGDRRRLAEFALSLTQAPGAGTDLDGLSNILFACLPTAGRQAMREPGVTGFVALENTTAGDRVIGVAAYLSAVDGGAEFAVAVLRQFREEQLDRSLLSTLLRHAKRVGVPRLTGEMLWSNRPMRILAQSMGFVVEPLAHDLNRRRLVLSLK